MPIRKILIRIIVIVALVVSLPYGLRLAIICYDRSWHQFEDEMHALWKQCKDEKMEPAVNCHEWAEKQYKKDHEWF